MSGEKSRATQKEAMWSVRILLQASNIFRDLKATQDGYCNGQPRADNAHDGHRSPQKHHARHLAIIHRPHCTNTTCACCHLVNQCGDGKWIDFVEWVLVAISKEDEESNDRTNNEADSKGRREIGNDGPHFHDVVGISSIRPLRSGNWKVSGLC